jgi:predicted metal-dependent enzyme (double-stranded beta helix superfamily)
MDVEAVVEPLRALEGEDDWGDIDAVEAETRKVLDALSDDRSVIRSVLADLPRRPDLLPLCEHYDILDKIVLWDDPTGFRVRLHVFLPGYFDRPHNHRWSYASTILRGQYRHYLFGNVELDETVQPRDLDAVMVRQEQVGDAYALHHSMVHAVVAEPYTVSLVVRGPAVKDRFLVMDRKTGESWWQYGAGQESAEDAAKKRMSVERFRELRGLLDEWGVS